MSLPLLAAARDWPSILLARAADLESDPTDIERATSLGAWKAYRDAVSDLSPDAVIRIITESGLRGRGGGGFPACRKWRDTATATERRRVVVANGFEADPGAQVDRTLMERDPHAVIEGLAIAAWAVRAEEAIVVVRASATTAAERLRAAIAAADERGYVGTAPAVTGRPLTVTVRTLSGSFVVGEETVLLRALEDRRAQPDQKPPYPSERGLWGRPTLVQNVKTLALVPWILANGAGAFASLGDPESPGTTLIQLGGTVRKPGVVEIPLSATIRDVLDGPGGFVAGRLKAVLVGGPTGGFLPEGALDTPLNHDALRAAGALSGSSTLLTVDDATCLVDVATLMTRYLNDQACGKTIPCRIGTRRLAELGAGMCHGLSRPTDADLVEDLARDIRDGALCALEGDAGNPLRSGMRYFAQEFEDHIVRGTCPAGVCQPVGAVGAVSR